MLRPFTDITAVPLQGGCITSVHKGVLPFGTFSMCQDVRGKHPGFKKRPGQIKLHSTADGSNEVMSLYQFKKQRISEKHFLAQMSDGDVLDATTAPPGVTGAAFGSEAYSGTGTGEVPASYSTLDDIMVYSNGVDQHQSYTGDDNYVGALIVYTGSAAPANVPEKGADYTIQATDGLTTTAVVLDSLNTYAAFSCGFICTPVPATKLTWTISLPNGTVSTATLYYRKSDNTWADTSMTDGTISGTTTLAQTGSMTWTAPTDEIPMYMYGQSGFWYQLRVSVQLDSEVEATKVTFGSGFQDMVNLWDGTVPYAIEAMHYDNSATNKYSTYATGSIVLNSMETAGGALGASDDKDKLYFSSTDPIMGIYVDVGATPNTASTAIVAGIKAWTGAAFTTVGTITDGTNGLQNSGWITFPRLTVEPTQFKTTQYYAYWYYLWIGTGSLSSNITISILTMPYFDIEEAGKGLCNCAWKDRGAYAFTRYGNHAYISADGYPFALNGADFGILKAGDGRRNNIAAMKKFHNELLVFQKESGVEGGTVTLFQGYTPDTFGKLLISSKVGTFSAKSAVVVDGVMTSTATNEEIKTLCFFLSRYGVCVTDGLTVSVISDEIQNYFDPTESECIRRGYEEKMWMGYDSAFNVIRIGLVSGSSATKPNIFPVFDLTDKTWSFDSVAQELSCFEEIEAGSGNVPVLQVAGGIDDGTVYLCNSGTNDVATAIDSYLTMELNANGQYIQLNEMMARAEAVAASAGDITITFTQNDIAAGTKTLSMSPEVSGQGIRRHRFPINIQDQNISVKIQNNAASKAMALIDVGFKTQIFDGR